jgi:hypothetical protein
MNIKVASPNPPCVFQSVVSGKWYAAGGGEWVEVPEGTTLNDIEWVRPVRAAAPKKQRPVQVQLVPGSTGNRYSVARWADGNYSCECWGYRRWKACKHIAMVVGVANASA